MRRERLRFKKRYSRLGKARRHRPRWTTLAIMTIPRRNSTSGFQSTDLDQNQHGIAARLGAEGQAPARLRTARRPLAHTDILRGVALRPHDRAVRCSMARLAARVSTPE